jgi:2-polyprenyl-3-methyl-5-hydroxy-6-metoxy-1,4-benzoquinol methylase
MTDMSSAAQHRHELRSGERFAFGRNWRRFLRTVDEQRIQASEEALLTALSATDLRGRSFLDAGCGSGLSALAALRSGARVTAFDYDPEAVLATRELLERWAPEGAEWTVHQGSVLDRQFVLSLGPHDIVHSWGVLHHTGSMWEACAIVAEVVPPSGTLFVALYNDAGAKSVAWARRKRRYVRLPAGARTVYAWGLILAAESMFLLRALLEGSPSSWWRRWTSDRPVRGMSRYRDWIDWIGGFPYEYTSPPDAIEFFRTRGLTGRVVTDDGGTGCNEFVLIRGDA